MLPVVMVPTDILIVRLSSIGGILLTTPLLRALRQRHPEARVTVVTRDRYAPLLKDNPHLDELITLGSGESPWHAARRLRDRSFTYRVDLQADFQSLQFRAGLPGRWRRHKPRRLARQLLIRTKRNLYNGAESVADQYFATLADLDVRPDGAGAEFFLNAAAEDEAHGWLQEAGIGQGRPLVAFAPGGPHAVRRWPSAHWAVLMNHVMETGADTVVVGGAEDAHLTTDMALQAGPRAASAAGSLSLQGTGALLKRAAALITNDTGLSHMSAGVGTPVIVLVGPTVRAFGRFPHHAHATVLERDLACRPCRAHDAASCPLGHHDCLETIRPDDVFNALARLLG